MRVINTRPKSKLVYKKKKKEKEEMSGYFKL